MKNRTPVAVEIDINAIKKAHHLCCDFLKEQNQRPVSMLVLAALIIEVHAITVGNPIEETLDIVRTFAKQLHRREPLNASTEFRKPS